MAETATVGVSVRTRHLWATRLSSAILAATPRQAPGLLALPVLWVTRWLSDQTVFEYRLGDGGPWMRVCRLAEMTPAPGVTSEASATSDTGVPDRGQ